jgi:hypothetical protein
MSGPLAVIEAIVDASGIAPLIEELLPHGVRSRQLSTRTSLIGMMLTLDDGRPAHLTRLHQALTHLPEADQARLGVLQGWKNGPHQLTYRPTEHTFHLVVTALSKHQPDGAPAASLQALCDALLEASIPAAHKNTSSALAADWTDAETWSRPPRHGTSQCADPAASWGHRTSNLPGPKGEMFFGYYLSAAVMAAGENGPPVPELARRMTLCSCHLDPARALVPVLLAMPAAGIALGDIIDDSGYAHRDAEAWAIPLRMAGAQLVQDLHPHDRGPRGTHEGAIIANGNLYCPGTPPALLQLGPLPPGATPEQTAAHDQQCAELARHKLGRHTADDADGYHRVTCPAVMGKIRCQLRPESMTLTRDRPEILTPPGHPPACCTQQTITVPPRGRGQDAPETRLPVGGLAAVLHPAHQHRANILDHQGPRHHQHHPRVVPPHGPDPPRPLARLPARHPQPAHPRRMEHPAARQRPPRRHRAPATHPPPEPQDNPRQPRHRTAIAHPQHHRVSPPTPAPTPRIQPGTSAATPRPPSARGANTTSSSTNGPRPGNAGAPTMSDPNVNIEPGEV